MDAAHDLSTYRDAIVVLATAAILVPLAQRWKLSPVLGFLLAGAVLGPRGLGSLAAEIPALSWVTIGNKDGLGALAELGVVFLLFLIGLELSLQRLVTMRKLVFGLGSLQVMLCASAIGGVLAVLGLTPAASVILGLSLALSSTAIVVEVLSEQNRLTTVTGRASFAVLLFQDLAVIPLILLVTILGPGKQGSVVAGLLQAVGQAVLAIGLIVAVGSLLLRPLFRLVASSDNTELFIAATLLVAVGSGVATAAAGLSMALGAFIAGLLLAETEFRRAIETALDPFKGLLLGVFFFTVGLSLDLGVFLNNPLPVLAAVILLVAIKAPIIALLMRLFGFAAPVQIKTGLLLAPGGEFAFIVIGLATAYGIVAAEIGTFALAVTSVSMALIPLFDLAARRLAAPIEAKRAAKTGDDPVLRLLPPVESTAKAIVIGHGRVGKLVSEMLSIHKVNHIVTERVPALVSEARGEGRPVYFGDGKSTQFLARCGLANASAVIITMHTWGEIDELVAAVRSMRPDIVIVARARDAEHARHLYELGVTDAVPETIEASLQLSEAALVGLGVPTGPVIASIHEKRDEFRATLQKAAAKVGLESRGLRAKRPGASKAGST